MIDRFFFNPLRCKEYSQSPNIKYIDKRYCYVDKGTDSSKVLLVARGNEGNINNSEKLVSFIRNFYHYDIFVIEYPGFGKMPGKTNINNCVECLYEWHRYLRTCYSSIDVYGLSIGSGIVLKFVRQYKIVPNILILHSPFSSFLKVIHHVRPMMGCILDMFINDDTYLCNQKEIQKIECENLYILHSKEDEVIPVDHALELEKIAMENKRIRGLNFIEIFGPHNNPTILNTSFLSDDWYQWS